MTHMLLKGMNHGQNGYFKGMNHGQNVIEGCPNYYNISRKKKLRI